MLARKQPSSPGQDKRAASGDTNPTDMVLSDRRKGDESAKPQEYFSWGKPGHSRSEYRYFSAVREKRLVQQDRADELNSCCSAQCVLCRRQSAHQVLVVVVPSLVVSSSCARDCVFMTRDMLRIMAQENLTFSSRPTIRPKEHYNLLCLSGFSWRWSTAKTIEMDRQAVTRCDKRTRLRPCNQVGVISTHSSTTCGSRTRLMFFQLHPLQLLREISFISRLLGGLKLMPQFIAASLQLGALNVERAVNSRLHSDEVLPEKYSFFVFRHQSFLSNEEFALPGFIFVIFVLFLFCVIFRDFYLSSFSFFVIFSSSVFYWV